MAISWRTAIFGKEKMRANRVEFNRTFELPLNSKEHCADLRNLVIETRSKEGVISYPVISGDSSKDRTISYHAIIKAALTGFSDEKSKEAITHWLMYLDETSDSKLEKIRHVYDDDNFFNSVLHKGLYLARNNLVSKINIDAGNSTVSFTREIEYAVFKNKEESDSFLIQKAEGIQVKAPQTVTQTIVASYYAGYRSNEKTVTVSTEYTSTVTTNSRLLKDKWRYIFPSAKSDSDSSSQENSPRRKELSENDISRSPSPDKNCEAPPNTPTSESEDKPLSSTFSQGNYRLRFFSALNPGKPLPIEVVRQAVGQGREVPQDVTKSL